MKPGQSVSLLRGAVALEMGDIEAQARRVVKESEQRSTEMLEQAERQSKHLIANAAQQGQTEGYAQGLAEGRDDGLKQGREEALQQGRAEVSALSKRFEQAIEEWEARRQQMFEDAREDVLRFAFALAERVVHRMLEVDPSIVRDQVVEALRHVGRPSELHVSVHPDDHDLLQQVMPEVCSTLGRTTQAQLQVDPNIERGGCVLATEGGYVDATIATQLDRLAEALLREGRLMEQVPENSFIQNYSPANGSADSAGDGGAKT